MSTPKEGVVRWMNVRGVNLTMNPDALPDGLVPSITNVELLPGCIGRRRPALNAFTASGTSRQIEYLYRFIGSDGIDSIWIFAEAAGVKEIDFVKNSVSTAVTPSFHTVNSFTDGVSCATLNNKLFIAYNSNINRLQVSADGSTIRSVGLIKPSPPTVGDTGAGAYAATARRYRVSFRIKSGIDIVVESELSNAVSFTPSGAGTAARVTKSVTVDSATHWVVWGLIGTSGDTYDLYRELGEIVVGTTTFDDSVNPGSYTGNFPAPLGLHIPPPSARFLLSTDNRLLMAGSFESSATLGETDPKDSRVWYTRVLGSSDIGDDETIPNTTAQVNSIDVGEGDGDKISGLAGPVDGVIYVFKTRSIWALNPTGNDESPYTVERITSAVGAFRVGLSVEFAAHNAILVAEDTLGQPSVYFPEGEAIYRLSPRSGLERVNEDISPALDGRSFNYHAAVYWPKRRQVIYVGEMNGVATVFVYSPRLAFRDELGVLRGGWSVYDVTGQFFVVKTVCLTTVSGNVVPLLGGGDDSVSDPVKIIGTFSANNSVQQDANLGSGSATNITASVTSAPYRLGQDGRLHVTLDEPTIEAAVTTAATPTVSYVRDYGTQIRTVVAPALAAVGSETRVAKKIQGLEMADARTFQVKYDWDTDQFGTSELTGAILIPWRTQEVR